MQKSHEESRLGILIGPDFEGEGKTFGKFEVHFFEKKASEQLEKLKKLANGTLDAEWSIVARLNALPGQGDQMLSGLKELHETFKSESDSDEYILKTFLEGDNVYLSIKGVPEVEAEYQEGFNMFYNQGLESIANDQENYLQGVINSNRDFSALLEGMNKGERLLSVLLGSLKLELFMNMHKVLASKIREMASTIDPELATEPPLIIFTKFRNFDIDLRFKSTDDLPQTIKNKVLFGKEITSNTTEENQFNYNELPGSLKVAEAIGDEHDFWLTIPNFFAGHLSVKTTKLSELLASYGNGIVEIIG